MSHVTLAIVSVLVIASVLVIGRFGYSYWQNRMGGYDQPVYKLAPPIAREYYTCAKCNSFDGGIYGKGPLHHFRSNAAAHCHHDWRQIDYFHFLTGVNAQFGIEALNSVLPNMPRGYIVSEDELADFPIASEPTPATPEPKITLYLAKRRFAAGEPIHFKSVVHNHTDRVMLIDGVLPMRSSANPPAIVAIRDGQDQSRSLYSHAGVTQAISQSELLVVQPG